MAGFVRTEADLLRIIQGILLTERMNQSELEIPPHPAHAPVPIIVTVKVTGPLITDTTPTFPESDGGVSSAGYYSGLFQLRNDDSEDPDDNWVEMEDHDGKCLVLSINGGELEQDRRYNGIVTGMRNEMPVVSVDVAGDAAEETSAGCGWVAALLESDCLRFSVLSGTGRCDCDDEGETTYWTPLADPITTTCCDDTPAVLLCTISGLTGDCAAAFPDTSIELTYSPDGLQGGWSGNTDAGSLRVYCDENDDWQAEITLDPGLAAGTLFTSNCDPFSLVFNFEFVSPGNPCSGDAVFTITVPEPVPVWSVLMTICEEEYLLVLTVSATGDPVLTLTSESGEGDDYVATLDDCGCNYATFAIGSPDICTEVTDSGAGPCGNLLKIKVEWVSCDPVTVLESGGVDCASAFGVEVGTKYRYTTLGDGVPVYFKVPTTVGTMYRFTFNCGPVASCYFYASDYSVCESSSVWNAGAMSSTDCRDHTASEDFILFNLVNPGEGLAQTTDFKIEVGPCPMMGTGTPKNKPDKKATKSLPLLECANEGNVLERCHTCNGEGKHVRECDVHGKCTYEPASDKIMNCRKCQVEGLGFTPAKS